MRYENKDKNRESGCYPIDSGGLHHECQQLLGRPELVGARTSSEEKDLLQGRQQLLDQYLKLAQSAIAKTYAAEDTPANREAVKSILRDLRYAEDGYFFVYDFNGVNQVLGPKPEMEGKDLSGLKDADGKPFIKNIIEAARSGDGFTQYLWDKPSVKKAVEKLSLSRTLDKYQWVLGTGFYIDDIETELAAQHSAAERAAYRAAAKSNHLLHHVAGDHRTDGLDRQSYITLWKRWWMP